MDGETKGWLIGGLIFGAVMILTIALRQVDSIENCSRSCHDQMASYTETRIEAQAPVGIRTLLVPVCTCATK